MKPQRISQNVQVFEKTVGDFVKRHSMFAATDRLLVGVSGGADSMGLLTYLKRRHAGPIAAVHVHHGIRGAAADADAALVDDFCKRQGIACRIVKVDVPNEAAQKKISLELAGRLARKRIFNELMAEYHCSRLVLAHHMNDQAETVMMRLIRGTGVAGAAGIQPVSGAVVRPFLCVKKDRITAYCEALQIPFRTDATNFDTRFTRNSIRQDILPQMTAINPKAVDHLADFAQMAAAYQREIDFWRTKLTDRWVTQDGGRLILDLSAFDTVSELMRHLIVQDCLIKAGKIMVDVEKRHVDAVTKLLDTGKTTWDLDMPHRVRVSRRYERLIFKPVLETKSDQRTPALPGRFHIVPGVRPQTVVGHYRIIVTNVENLQKKYKKGHLINEILVNYGRIKHDLVLRRREPGDTLKIQGVGHRKLKKFLIDHKIDKNERASMLFLADGPRILWIPGIWQDAEIGTAQDQNDMGLLIRLEKIGDE
jgi:tRNA(Ile)-lysidine synthase